MDGDGDRIRLTLPRVHGRSDDHAIGETMTFDQAIHHVLRIIDCLVPGGEHGDECVAARVIHRDRLGPLGLTCGAVDRLLDAEATGEELIQPSLHRLEQRRVDIGSLGIVDPSTSTSVGAPGRIGRNEQMGYG